MLENFEQLLATFSSTYNPKYKNEDDYEVTVQAHLKKNNLLIGEDIPLKLRIKNVGSKPIPSGIIIAI